jgi:hypothetical protein
VAGRPGARYAIQARNATGARVLGVMAVDGVNIISGETASWRQTGYVLDPWGSAEITGWRKSDAEVAAFHFTALPNSYAARTGRPDNVGVIGVAVFREQAPPPPPPPALVAPEPMSGAPAPAASARRAEANQLAPSAEMGKLTKWAAPPAAARLGTGRGGIESSSVSHTDFERRRDQPDEVITIRYDSYENLVALGVIPADPPPTRRPAPFPRSTVGYTPDPPGWR